MKFLKVKLRPLFGLVAVIWIVEIVNFSLSHRLTVWGILPRNLSGLIGIPLAPFIHAGFWHAVSNTIPLIILGGLTITAGSKRFWTLTVGIALLSGIFVWLFARDAYHVGASGLVFGYFGALLARAAIERTILSIIIAFVSITMYGGLLWGVLPIWGHYSFEGHLFGLLAGIAVVWLDRRSSKLQT
jgi:membrane associated rhomboid family serine protease